MEIELYKHDYHVLPSIMGLRKRPSCRVSDFLLSPIDDDGIFGLIGEATFQRKGEALTRTIQALIALRGKRRLSKSAIQTLRGFRPIAALLNRDTLSRLDVESRAVWRHNCIVRMIAGQRSVWETMRLLRIAPQPWEVETVAPTVDPRIVEMWAAYQARPADDMPF